MEKKGCRTGQERRVRDGEAVRKGQQREKRARERKWGVEEEGGGSEQGGRHRQLSHISGLIGTDKVLLEDSVPTALFALESQGQIYYD